MNAIDQYVAPAPPRPNPQPAQSPRGSDTSGSPTFGDVYNKAANANQSGNDASDPQKAGDDAPPPKADAKTGTAAEKAAPEGEKKSTGASGAGTAIFALAADLKGKKTGKDADQAVDAKVTEDPVAVVPKQDGKDKAADDIQKLIDKTKTAQADAQPQAPAAAAATETDAAAIALKLLGADATTKGADKKVQPEEAGKKEEPAENKATDAKADAGGATTDAANTLAAASLLVHAAGGQAKDQQEQGKPKSDDLPAKTVGALGPQGLGGASSDETTTSGAGDAVKPETVTVLDARRFVGSGETISANTQAVMSGVSGNGDWAAAMKAASAAATETPEPRTATPVNTLKIQMTPESLGNVTATLRLHGDQLTVHLQVESGEAFKQLSQDKEGLIQSLKSQGFSVDQVSVQLAPAPATDKTVAQTSAGQQSGGQMQDGSSPGQFAQQGREQDNNRRQQDNGFNANWQGDDKNVVADPVAPGSDTPRAGQVYL